MTKRASRAARETWSPAQLLRAQWAIGLVMVIPAVMMPGGLDRFTFPKLLCAAIGIGLAFTVPVVGRPGRWVWALVGIGTLAVLVSAAASDSFAVSLVGRAPRFEGAPVLAVYALAAWAGVRLLGPGRDRRLVNTVSTVMAWCALAVAALAILEALGARPLSSDMARPGSLLGNASDQGAFAALYAGPLAVAALRKPRVLLVAGVVATVVTAVVSGSRGALVGLVAVFVVVAFTAGRRYWRQVVAGFVGAAVLALLVPMTRDRLLGLSPLSGRTITGRGLLWRETMSLLADHPVLGVGPSHFLSALVPYHDLGWQQTIGPENPPGEPHNMVLQAWVVGGLPLLVVVGWLGVLVIKRNWASLRVSSSDVDQDQRGGAGGNTAVAGLVAGLVGYVVALQFHVLSPSVTIPACVIAGALVALPSQAHMMPRQTRQPRPEPPHPSLSDRLISRAVVVCCTALAVLFGAASIGEVYLLRAAQAVTDHDYAAASDAYRTAHTLRRWDIGLAGRALIAFVKPASSGDDAQGAAAAEADYWAHRLGRLADDEQVAYNRAVLYQVNGDFDAAAAILDTQLTVDPFNPTVLTLRGVVAAQNESYQDALGLFNRALEVDPDDPRPWHNIAVVQHALGNDAEAQDAQRKAQQLADAADDGNEE